MFSTSNIVVRAIIGAVIGFFVGVLLNNAMLAYKNYRYKRTIKKANKTLRKMHLLNRN